MNPVAVELAETKLQRARKALDDLRSASNFAEAEAAWSDFLLAAAGVYSKLEQGAKSHGKSVAWFGRKKRERKDHPLLRYLHFARNSDEHGIERITSRNIGNSGFPNKPLKFGERMEIFVQNYDPDTKQSYGDKVRGIMPGPHIAMVRAADSRFGDYCDPPRLFVNEGVLCRHPDVAAEQALPLLAVLVREASELTVAS